MVSIGIDIGGGDHAPQAALEGCQIALPDLGEDSLVLIGPKSATENELAEELLSHKNCEFFEAPDLIGMDKNPVQMLLENPRSALSVGMKLMAEKRLHGFASAGNSGALMVAAVHILKNIEGVSRPCAVASFPKMNGGKNVILDVGINAEAKPELLAQFGQLGKIYSQVLYKKENPKIALLNTGTEAGKGSILYQKTYELLRDSDLNFMGNIEGRDLFDTEADVTVCDGFVGNIVLKQAEGFYQLLKTSGLQNDYFDTFDYEKYGGTPILGVQGNVLLGHGASGPIAFSNMILQTRKTARFQLSEQIQKAFQH